MKFPPRNRDLEKPPSELAIMRNPLARFSPLWQPKRHRRKGKTIPSYRLLELCQEWEAAGHDPARVINAAMLDDRVDDDTKLELALALIAVHKRRLVS